MSEVSKIGQGWLYLWWSLGWILAWWNHRFFWDTQFSRRPTWWGNVKAFDVFNQLNYYIYIYTDIYIYQETNTDWWGTSNSSTAVFYTGDWKHWRRSFQCLNDSVFYSTHMIGKGFLATMQISGLQICHIHEKVGPRTTGMILYHGSMCVCITYIYIYLYTLW